MFGGETVDGEIVDHPARLVADRRVQHGAVDHPPLHITHQHPLQQGLRVRPFDVDRTLVVHVIDPDRLARGHVLPLRGGEHDGRIEPDPIAELGPESDELVVVGGASAGR